MTVPNEIDVQYTRQLKVRGAHHYLGVIEHHFSEALQAAVKFTVCIEEVKGLDPSESTSALFTKYNISKHDADLITSLVNASRNREGGLEDPADLLISMLSRLDRFDAWRDTEGILSHSS